MADRSKIEWTDATWNPLRAHRAVGDTIRTGWHCEHVSPGCANCYAEAMNRRLGTGLPFKPGHREDIRLALDHRMLTQPLRWKKPRMIFVCSMTDLFAEFVEDEWIDKMFAVMALCPQHTFQVLTKRPDRMRKYVSQETEAGRLGTWARVTGEGVADALEIAEISWNGHANDRHSRAIAACGAWPLPNVWLGTSVEDQATADERIPDLLATPAAIRFVSYEPALGPVDWINIDACGSKVRGMWNVNALTGENDDMCRPCKPVAKLDWIIAGGESGPKSRPCHPDWIRQTRDQCAAAGTAFLFKQWGSWRPADRSIIGPRVIMGRNGHVRSQGSESFYDDDAIMVGVDKKAAGRTLDGMLHDGFPLPGQQK